MEESNSPAGRNRHFLLYWKPETVEDHLATHFRLTHAGSNQLNTIQRGETIWIVTLFPDGELVLAGKIEVGEATNAERARQVLGTDDLWPSRYHVIAKAGTADYMRRVSLTNFAPELRFQDAQGTELEIKSNGEIERTQFKSMRVLTDTTAELLDQVWMDSVLEEETIVDDIGDEAELEDMVEEDGGEAEVERLQAVLALDEHDPMAHYNVGVALNNAGRHSDAAIAYKESIRLDPESFGAHYNLASTYCDLGLFEEAVREFETTINLQPEFCPGAFYAGPCVGLSPEIRSGNCDHENRTGSHT